MAGFEVFRGTGRRPGLPIQTPAGVSGEMDTEAGTDGDPLDCLRWCDAAAECTGLVLYTDIAQCAFRGGEGQSREDLRRSRTVWTPAVLYIKKQQSTSSLPPLPLPPSDSLGLGDSRVTPLIIDTDLSIDVDDLGALCVAHALADRGEVELLAMLHGTGLDEGVGGISVVNHFYGRDFIPIGAYRGDVGNPAHTFNPDWTNNGAGWYVNNLVEAFDSPI